MKNELGELLGKSPKEMEKVRTLWENCFHDPQRYMDFYFKWKTIDNTIFGIYDDEELISMVQLNPYRVSILNHEFSSYYIVGVATNADYRKRGLMRRLLTQGMNYMYQEEVPFAYLMPAKEEIYLPFDFRIVTYQDRMSIPLKQVIQNAKEPIVKAASLSRDIGSRLQEVKTVLVDETDTAMLSRLAQYANGILASSNDVYTVRDTYYYERMLAELLVLNGGILMMWNEKEIIGYGAFAIEEGKLEVLELLADETIQEDLLTQLNYEVLRRLEESWLEEDNEVEPTKAPPIMARIIHVPKFLQQLRATEDIELVIEVHDEYIKENEGIYQLACHLNDCYVTKTIKTKYNDSNIDLVCNMAQLTSLFFGQIEESELTQLILGDKDEVKHKLCAIEYLNHVHINEIV